MPLILDKSLPWALKDASSNCGLVQTYIKASPDPRMLSSRKKVSPSFQQCQPEVIVLAFVGDEDAERLELAFSKKRIEERKAWLQGFEMGTFLDQSADEISYTDFVDKASVAADPIMLCILTESSCLYETIVWTPSSLQETLRGRKIHP